MTRFTALIVAGGVLLVSCAPADDPDGLTVDQSIEVDIPSSDPETDWTGYRASGNEPFWSVVLTDSAMQFTLLGTEVVASTVKPEPAATTNGWRFETLANGQPFAMEVSLEGCTDSMSGRPFPHTVSVVVRAQTYMGCGGDTATLLTGPEWRVIHLQGNETTSTPPTMTFGEDGSVTGTGGCNNYRGTYEITGEGIVMGPAAATRMACADDAVNQQEVQFFSLLEEISRFDVVEGRLQLYTQDTIVLVAER